MAVPTQYTFPGCQQIPRPRIRETSLTSVGLSSFAGTTDREVTVRQACREVESIARQIGEAICREFVATSEVTVGVGVPL
jgi:hypothetical protein